MAEEETPVPSETTSPDAPGTEPAPDETATRAEAADEAEALEAEGAHDAPEDEPLEASIEADEDAPAEAEGVEAPAGEAGGMLTEATLAAASMAEQSAPSVAAAERPGAKEAPGSAASFPGSLPKRGGMERLANYRPTRHFTSKTFERKWLVVDAAGQSVGRLASQVATLLKGKHRPEYTPHDDVGDFVVVVNASKVELRGNDKPNKKLYHKYTGYRGNLKTRTGAEMLDRHPEKLVQLAVSGMLPRGSRGSRMLEKLKVYSGPDHPHAAQKPQTWHLEGQGKRA